MLYLIRTFGRGKDRTALKVGFTDNLSERLFNYYTSNPFFELITTREGTIVEEMKMHLYLQSFGYKERFLNEWFRDESEIVLRFHDDLHRINRAIWKNRDILFTEQDFKQARNKTKLGIYTELQEKFGTSDNSLADGWWLMVENLKAINETKRQYRNVKRLYE